MKQAIVAYPSVEKHVAKIAKLINWKTPPKSAPYLHCALLQNSARAEFGASSQMLIVIYVWDTREILAYYEFSSEDPGMPTVANPKLTGNDLKTREACVAEFKTALDSGKLVHDALNPLKKPKSMSYVPIDDIRKGFTSKRNKPETLNK